MLRMVTGPGNIAPNSLATDQWQFECRKLSTSPFGARPEVYFWLPGHGALSACSPGTSYPGLSVQPTGTAHILPEPSLGAPPENPA